MDHDVPDSMRDDADARGRWLHDLRNAVNVLGTTVSLSHRLLEKQRQDEAMAVLRNGMQALQQSEALLRDAGPVIGLYDDRDGEPPRAGASAPRDVHLHS